MQRINSKKVSMVRVVSAAFLVIVSFSNHLSAAMPCECSEKHNVPWNQAKNPGDKRFVEIRKKIINMVSDEEIPSMAVSVAKEGRILWEEAFGWANREDMLKATPHTIYALGSLSKSITATGLMLLVEKGLVKLNDPVEKYLGPVMLRDYLGIASQIKVYHVLSMTAGIPHLWKEHKDDDPNPPLPVSELINRYGFSISPPGEMFLYSNLAFAFPEQMIPVVTGQTFENFMEKEVLLPLGMKDQGTH